MNDESKRWADPASRADAADGMRERQAWRKSAATKRGYSRYRRFQHEALAAALSLLGAVPKA